MISMQGHPIFRSAIAWSLFGVLADCGMDVFGKLVTFSASPWQAVCLRWAYGTLFLSLILLVLRRRPRMVRPSVHLARLLLNLGAGYCYFAALTALPLAVVVTLAYTQPLFIVLAAHVFLGERLRPRRLGGIVMGLAGVVLTAQPWAAGATELWPLVLAVLSAAGWGFLVVTTRGAGRGEAVLDLMFWLALLTMLATLPMAWLNWQPLQVEDHGVFFSLAVFGLFSGFCWLTALKLGEAAVSAGVHFLTLPVTYLAAYLVFDERLTPLSLLGAGVVLCGVALVALPGRRMATPVAQTPQ